MVKRVCLCGCSLSFKVLSTNTKTYFYSRFHASICLDRPGEIGELARLQCPKQDAGVGAGRNGMTREAKKRRRIYYATNFNPDSDADDADNN